MAENKKHGKVYLWWVSRELTSVYFMVSVICILVYLVAAYKDADTVCTVCTIIMFVTAIMFLVHNNQRSLHRFLHGNEEVVNLPQKQIRQLNKFFLMIFLVIAAVVMLLMSRAPYEGVLGALWEFIKTILRGIGSAISAFFDLIRPGENVIEPPAAVTPAPWIDEFLAEEPVSEPSQFWTYFVTAFGILALAALLCLIIYTIYKKLSTYFAGSVLEERELISPFEKKGKEASAKSARKAERITQRLSINGRIRRLYRKTIQNNISTVKTPVETLTPAELEQKAGITKAPFAEILHDTYEKARYSEVSCTKGELEELKRQLKAAD